MGAGGAAGGIGPGASGGDRVRAGACRPCLSRALLGGRARATRRGGARGGPRRGAGDGVGAGDRVRALAVAPKFMKIGAWERGRLARMLAKHTRCGRDARAPRLRSSLKVLEFD